MLEKEDLLLQLKLPGIYQFFNFSVIFCFYAFVVNVQVVLLHDEKAHPACCCKY